MKNNKEDCCDPSLRLFQTKSNVEVSDPTYFSRVWTSCTWRESQTWNAACITHYIALTHIAAAARHIFAWAEILAWLRLAARKKAAGNKNRKYCDRRAQLAKAVSANTNWKHTPATWAIPEFRRAPWSSTELRANKHFLFANSLRSWIKQHNNNSSVSHL